MAKMKVYELAQEIGVKSAEILTVLKSKGIEVKSHMSVLEDEQIAEVRNAMKTPKSTPIKAAEAPKPAQDAAAAKPAQTPKAADAPKTAPIKKKKSIIFVSNPDNSRMKGAQIPRKPAHPVEKKAEPAAAAKPVNTVKPAPVPVQETPKPAPAPAQEAPKPASVQEAPKPAPVQEVKERPEQEKPVAVKPENRAENRDTNRDNSRDNNRSDNRGGQRRDGSRDNNNRRDNQGGRPGQGFNSGRDNRGGFAGKGSGKNSGFVPESPVKDAEKHRDEEKRRIGQEKDKRNRKDFMYEEDDNAAKNAKGKNKPGKFIKPEKKPVEQVEEQIKVITLPEMITIKELADKMKIQPSAIVKKLFLQGQIVTVNQEIAYETAENIAMEYDILCEQEVKVDVIEELLKEDEEDPASMIARPPVICVMGHD